MLLSPPQPFAEGIPTASNKLILAQQLSSCPIKNNANFFWQDHCKKRRQKNKETINFNKTRKKERQKRGE